MMLPSTDIALGLRRARAKKREWRYAGPVSAVLIAAGLVFIAWSAM